MGSIYLNRRFSTNAQSPLNLTRDKMQVSSFVVAYDVGFETMFTNDGSLKNPFGHSWSFAPHIEDVDGTSPEARMKELFSQET